MHQEQYQLIVSGQVIQGMSLPQVARNLVNGFKFSKEQIKQLLNGKPRVIKTSHDLAAIKKLSEKFTSLGVNCYIRPLKPAQKPQPSIPLSSLNKPQIASNTIKRQTTVAKPAVVKPAVARPAIKAPGSVANFFSFPVFPFNPKFFSGAVNKSIQDKAGNNLYQICRDKLYLGWMLLFPLSALVASLCSYAAARYLMTSTQNSVQVMISAGLMFIASWLVTVLLARPITSIDILSERANDSAVLQQTRKLFFRDREFYLSTDNQDFNAVLSYDAISTICECESMDSSIRYTAAPLQSSGSTAANFIAAFFGYFKDIPLRLLPIKTRQRKSFKVLDRKNKVVAMIHVGKEVEIEIKQPEANGLYLVSIALLMIGA